METKPCPVCQGEGEIKRQSKAFLIGTIFSQILFIILIVLGCWKVIDLFKAM